jgi:hypothetical protein
MVWPEPGHSIGIVGFVLGGSFRRLTVFALGIMPYITASIILQLLTVVWPYRGEVVEGRGAGAPQDYNVYPLSDSHPFCDSIDGDGHGVHA